MFFNIVGKGFSFDHVNADGHRMYLTDHSAAIMYLNDFRSIVNMYPNG